MIGMGLDCARILVRVVRPVDQPLDQEVLDRFHELYSHGFKLVTLAEQDSPNPAVSIIDCLWEPMGWLN